MVKVCYTKKLGHLSEHQAEKPPEHEEEEEDKCQSKHWDNRGHSKDVKKYI